MKDYLYIPERYLLGAYKAGLSAGELIDLVTVSEAGGKNNDDRDHPRAPQSITLLESISVCRPQTPLNQTNLENTVSAIPNSVVKVALINRSKAFLLALIATCLFWDKYHPPEYWRWLYSLGIEHDAIERAVLQAKKSGLIRRMRSRPDIGRRHAKDYRQGTR